MAVHGADRACGHLRSRPRTALTVWFDEGVPYKGVGIYALEIRGRAAHAGAEPERGVSAIDELAHQVLALHEFRDADRGITINIGTVEGGTASNVVADRVTAAIDVRFNDRKDGAEIDGAASSPEIVVD